MTNKQRKQWCFDNLARDSSGRNAARDNVTKHGAEKIIAMMSPTDWPESYGQTPFDETWSLACRVVRGECVA